MMDRDRDRPADIRPMAGYSAVTFLDATTRAFLPDNFSLGCGSARSSPCCWSAGGRLAGAVSTMIGRIPRLAGLAKRPTTGLTTGRRGPCAAPARAALRPARSAASALSPRRHSRPDGRSGPRPPVLSSLRRCCPGLPTCGWALASKTVGSCTGQTGCDKFPLPSDSSAPSLCWARLRVSI
jgi:hypothetical protein